MNKYRIWNSTLNCWVSEYCKTPGENEIQYFVDPAGKLRKFVRTLSDGGIFIEDVLLDNYVVQFFTGLYDADNNQIFEGDIVRWSLAGINGIEIHTISIIKYEHFGFVLSDCLGGGAIPLTYVEDMKIIGNIFERPCKADHNGECIFCDENISECPI